MPDFMWLALVVFLAVVCLAILGLSAAGCYLILQLAREKRLEANANFNAPIPRDDDDLTDEESVARLDALLDAAKDQGQMAKDEWVEEKRAEGWTDEDITDFLANRPLLELN